MTRRASIALLSFFLFSCATSPLGRRQLQLFPEGELTRMGAAAFSRVKAETPRSYDPRINRYVRCVADAITGTLERSLGRRSWEVVVFREDSANAFALPGGKIGVYTGLLKVARNQDQLAAVIGHEIAHVVAGHPNERVSTATAAQIGLDLVQILAGAPSPGQQRLMGLLGLGTEVGVLLPFSRAQEREADLLGLDLMARAGFDPRQSVRLWRHMRERGGSRPPELLSTHPSRGSRVRDLSDRMPHALALYEEARAAGRHPRCR